MLWFGNYGWRGTKECFTNKSKSAEEVVETIVWTVSEWECNSKDFIGISLEDLN